MFGPSYLTIGAYISNGGVYCPSCWKTPDDSDASYQLERDAAVSVAQLEEAYSDEGLWCDDCGKEIVEPDVDEIPDDDYEEPSEEAFEDQPSAFEAESNQEYLNYPLPPESEQ